MLWATERNITIQGALCILLDNLRERWSDSSECKIKGNFVWHSHKEEDELFYVIKGKLKMQFRNETKEIHQGEMIVVPKGVEHRPSAEEETWILLFEPVNTKHTGETISDITKESYPKI